MYGDTHLSSKNYGAHRDYASESLLYYKSVIDIAEEECATHLVCLGDFAQTKFHQLEYRINVEKELERASRLTNGNHYCLQGNHDISTKGIVERDYYINRGLLKGSTSLDFKDFRVDMIDYGKESKFKLSDVKAMNVVLAHNFFSFKDTAMPCYGNAIELDNFKQWYGVDLIISGHIHKSGKYSGRIIKDNRAKNVTVFNLGCPCRMSYEDDMQEKGNVMFIDYYSDGSVSLFNRTFDLLPLDKSFNLVDRLSKERLNRLKGVDVSEISQKLDSYDGYTGDPVKIISSMLDIDEKYREKALELLIQQD